MYFILLVEFLNISFVYGSYFVVQRTCATSASPSSVMERWIEQPLDHFDPNEKRTWSMKYYENLELFQPNGTIYLSIGGEIDACDSDITSDNLLYDLAKETNGAMFVSEHRYYGGSMPLDNKNTENLKYLSSQQALADIATLLTTIRSSPKFQTCKVVAIGASYAGMLAAWVRLLYPHLIDAAIASSAPVLAKKDFYEYTEAVADDYKKFGLPGCYEKIGEIFNRYDHLFTTSNGIKELKKEENICEENDMTIPENRHLFFLGKINFFKTQAQYMTPQDIKFHCDTILSNSSGAASLKHFDDKLKREERKCEDYDFYHKIEDMKNDSNFNSWLYQTCTEFGYFESTSSDAQPFTKNVPVIFFYKRCSTMYGAEFNEERIDKGIKYTNELYGGLKPNVTNVVFVNGDMDPWSRLGILKDITYDAPAKVIHNASHCRDLRGYYNDDTEEVKGARSYIKKLIKKWIGSS